jgi:hypothetical protein
MRPKHLLVSGLILIAVGAVWFFRSLGLGGGSGSVLVLLIGIACCIAALVIYAIRRTRWTR